MDPWITTLISVAGAGAVALAARIIDRRRGVPSEVDAAIDSHVETVIALLNTKIAVLEASKTDCEKSLSKTTEQLALAEGRIDELSAQVTRLLLRTTGP